MAWVKQTTLIANYSAGGLRAVDIVSKLKALNPIQYGLFLKHYGMGGGGIMAPLVTSLFLKVEGQNLVPWGILKCLLQKWH